MAMIKPYEVIYAIEQASGYEFSKKVYEYFRKQASDSRYILYVIKNGYLAATVANSSAGAAVRNNKSEITIDMIPKVDKNKVHVGELVCSAGGVVGNYLGTSSSLAIDDCNSQGYIGDYYVQNDKEITKECMIRVEIAELSPATPSQKREYQMHCIDMTNHVYNEQTKHFEPWLPGVRYSWQRHPFTKYYFLNDLFMVDSTDYVDSSIDHLRIKAGNCFGSVKAAERISEKLKNIYK